MECWRGRRCERRAESQGRRVEPGELRFAILDLRLDEEDATARNITSQKPVCKPRILARSLGAKP